MKKKMKVKSKKVDEIVEDFLEVEIAPTEKSEAVIAGTMLENSDADAYDDDAPETVNANSEDIKRLRELHEQMMLPANKRFKKKKVKPLPIFEEDKKVIGDQELDSSILVALGDLNEHSSSEDRLTEAEEYKKNLRTLSKRKRKGVINVHVKKSRKIGNIDVEVLEDTENIISAYSLSNEARSFAATITTSQPRINFASFSSKKLSGPCLKFAERAARS